MHTNIADRSWAVGFMLGGLVWLAAILPVGADVFTIDPAQSSLTLSGTIAGYAFQPQGANSLTTTYGGTIQAAQTGGTIQFTGASLITANTNGNWTPLAGGGSYPATAPADYGAYSVPFGFEYVYAAFRSVQFDVTSPAVTVTGNQFNASALTFLFPVAGTSALDYYYTGFTSGSSTLVLTGNATNNVSTNATLTTVGSTQTLKLSVNALFNFTVATYATPVTVTGQLVATRTTATTPVVIQIPTVTNQVITLKWQSPTGQVYQVQSSSNLLNWQTNASNITSGSTNYSWTGTNAAAKEFYRLEH